MNETNSQMQFLQLVCVVLVMATLIGLVASYIMYRDLQNFEQQLADAKDQIDHCKSDRAKMNHDLKILKNLAGYQLPEVGGENATDPNTVVGKARQDIKGMVGSQARPDLREALITLHDRLVQVTDERNTLKEQLEKLAVTPGGGPEAN